jgi:hypothetical protein
LEPQRKQLWALRRPLCRAAAAGRRGTLPLPLLLLLLPEAAESGLITGLLSGCAAEPPKGAEEEAEEKELRKAEAASSSAVSSRERPCSLSGSLQATARPMRAELLCCKPVLEEEAAAAGSSRERPWDCPCHRAQDTCTCTEPACSTEGRAGSALGAA